MPDGVEVIALVATSEPYIPIRFHPAITGTLLTATVLPQILEMPPEYNESNSLYRLLM